MEPNDVVCACLGWLKLGWCLSDVPRMSKMKTRTRRGTHIHSLSVYTPTLSLLLPFAATEVD